mgnify:CR=1 FL=1
MQLSSPGILGFNIWGIEFLINILIMFVVSHFYPIKKEFKIENMIADMLELAKPNNALCKDDCKGLCSKCGIQLDHESCKCNRININNPFDKLKFL